MTDYAFTALDICRLEAGVFDWNPASASVLEEAAGSEDAQQPKPSGTERVVGVLSSKLSR